MAPSLARDANMEYIVHQLAEFAPTIDFSWLLQSILNSTHYYRRITYPLNPKNMESIAFNLAEEFRNIEFRGCGA